MAVKFDSIHWNSRKIDSYNKDFNFIFGPREPGKTTFMWFKKIYLNWKKDKRPWIYLVRNAVEISEALIQSIFDVNINKFIDEYIEPQYTKGTFKEGVVDVKIEGEVFFRIVSLNLPLRRIKLAILRNAVGAYMDEYIVNPRNGEKYNKDEYYKIQEAYTTWRRECEGRFKFYFTANPYSLFNPIFVGLNVDLSKLKKGEVLTGDFWAIEWVVLTPELRALLLHQNPFYKFDEEYSDYALEGSAINDKHIKLSTFPENYSLQFVLRYEGKEIGIFKNNYTEEMKDKFYCCELSNYSSKRTVYCFSFDEIVGNSALIAYEDRQRFSRLKKALQKNEVAFSTIPIYYLIVELYTYF